MPVFDSSTLQPGDILLFDRHTLIGQLIKTKTWSDVSHIEIYSGIRRDCLMTMASREGMGVNHYHLNPEGLVYVLRPTLPFHLDAALQWFDTEALGQGYDYLGLLNFFAAKRQGRENGKMFCSELATRVCRQGGFDPFNGYDADGIAPATFKMTSAFRYIYQHGLWTPDAPSTH